MTWLTAMEYICHKWPRICSTCRKHFPILSSFMTYHRVWSIVQRRVSLVKQAVSSSTCTYLLLTSCIVHILEEMLKDTKGVIRIRISKKNRQHDGQKKKYDYWWTKYRLEKTETSLFDIPFPVHFNCVEKILHEELKHMTIVRIFLWNILFSMCEYSDAIKLPKSYSPPPYGGVTD
jgi:hypothetical protein